MHSPFILASHLNFLFVMRSLELSSLNYLLLHFCGVRPCLPGSAPPPGSGHSMGLHCWLPKSATWTNTGGTSHLLTFALYIVGSQQILLNIRTSIVMQKVHASDILLISKASDMSFETHNKCKLPTADIVLKPLLKSSYLIGEMVMASDFTWLFLRLRVKI